MGLSFEGTLVKPRAIDHKQRARWKGQRCAERPAGFNPVSRAERLGPGTRHVPLSLFPPSPPMSKTGRSPSRGVQGGPITISNAQMTSLRHREATQPTGSRVSLGPPPLYTLLTPSPRARPGAKAEILAGSFLEPVVIRCYYQQPLLPAFRGEKVGARKVKRLAVTAVL